MHQIRDHTSYTDRTLNINSKSWRNRLIQIANDTPIALRNVATYTYANRKSIRNTCNRFLRTEIKRAVEK